MTFVEYLNEQLRVALSLRPGPTVVYGQNVATGSCLSGLTRGMDTIPGCTTINTSNAENTLVGMGFGLMLRGVDALLCLKQQDFLLLGIDQLVNTWNALRHRDVRAAFAVITIVVDNGWEGPQSCLNNLDDFCSLSRIPGHVINTRHEADAVIHNTVFTSGVKIIALPQRLWRSPMPDLGSLPPPTTPGIQHYRQGDAATVVTFNFALSQGLGVADAFARRGQTASLFSVTDVLCRNWDAIIADVQKTKRLIVLDDSKSINRSSDALLLAAKIAVPEATITPIRRAPFTEERSSPNSDSLTVDAEALVEATGKDML
ncbi:MAG: hypothetical protein JXQ84_05345 [Rhodospirillaceae bacterium]|nr:hypothetical protein [Rhodospirillaceae bacterium]